MSRVRPPVRPPGGPSRTTAPPPLGRLGQQHTRLRVPVRCESAAPASGGEEAPGGPYAGGQWNGARVPPFTSLNRPRFENVLSPKAIPPSWIGSNVGPLQWPLPLSHR